MDEMSLIKELGDRAAVGHEHIEEARELLAESFRRTTAPQDVSARASRGSRRPTVLTVASCLVLIASVLFGAIAPASGDSFTCGGETATVVGTSGADQPQIDVPGSVVVTNGGDDQLSVSPDALTAPQTILICEQSGGTPYRLDIKSGN